MVHTCKPRACLKDSSSAIALSPAHPLLNVGSFCAPAIPLQVAELKKHARPVKGSSEIKSVAAISAGNDDEIGQMIADALDKVRGC